MGIIYVVDDVAPRRKGELDAQTQEAQGSLRDAGG